MIDGMSMEIYFSPMLGQGPVVSFTNDDMSQEEYGNYVPVTPVLVYCIHVLDNHILLVLGDDLSYIIYRSMALLAA